MRWGEVAPRNEAWLRANEDGLAKCLARIAAALARDNDRADFGPGLRYNAGMTKVYSLLLDHFVIYDSRVAGALAWFAAAWATEHGSRRIPGSLRFPCMGIARMVHVISPSVVISGRQSFIWKIQQGSDVSRRPQKPLDRSTRPGKLDVRWRCIRL